MAQTEIVHFFDSLHIPFMVFKVTICFLDESKLHMSCFLLFNSFLLILYHEWHENQLQLILYREWYEKKKTQVLPQGWSLVWYGATQEVLVSRTDTALSYALEL